MSIYSEAFEKMYGTSYSLQSLKEKVLKLAMKGELTKENNYGDSAKQTASNALKQRGALEKSKQIKKWKKIDKHISHGYEYPDTWVESFLGDIGDWGSGATPKRGNSEYWFEGTVPWVKTGELTNSYVYESQEFITKKALNETSVRLNKKGDVLIAMYGATIGKLGILDFEATTNQACCACTPFEGIYNKYIFYLLMSLKQVYIESGEGGAQPNISKEKIVNTVFGLPSTEEQHDIVQNIEYMFSIIDKLGKCLVKKEHLLELLPQGVVDAIGSCQTSEELKTQLEVVIENFEEIFQTPESMQSLRNVILQLAIEGKLVDQDPSDEPASELLKKIKAERDQLVAEKKIKKPKKLEPIIEDEIPFEIPGSWEWVRLVDYGYSQTGTTPSTKKSEFYNGAIPFIKPADITPKSIRYSNESLSELGLSAGRSIEKGSNMMVCIGGSTGKSFYTDRQVSCNQQINTLTPLADIDCKFTHYILTSSYFYEKVWELSTGTATPIINKSTWDSIVVPMPPLQEQRKIIQCVESLMNTINDLEERLDMKKRISELLGRTE